MVREEPKVQIASCCFCRRNISRTSLSCKFQKCFFLCLLSFFFKNMFNKSMVTKKFADFISSVTKAFKEKSKSYSVSSVENNVKDFISPLFNFNIHTTLWNDLSNKCGIVLIIVTKKVVVWRFDNLIYNNSFNAIENERAVLSHIRNIPKENNIFNCLSGFFNNKTSLNIQRNRISCTSSLAFLFRIFRFFIHNNIEKIKFSLTAVIYDRRKLV